MPAHPKLTPRRIVALLLALFLLLRLAQALTSTHSYDDEEGYTLTAAFELINHDVWPYQAYQLSDWENGSRVVVWVAAALTWLLGPCLLVLKLTGIIFSCALLAALYLVASAVAGPRAGLLAGLLYIFFPEPVFHYSMTAHGFHTDSVFLQLLFLWRLVRALQGARRIRDLLLCGLLGGLAVWFAYISVSLVLAGSVLLLWRVLRDREQTARRRAGQVAAYVAAGAVGAVLLVAYNMDNGWAGLKIYDAHSVATYVAPTDLGKKLVHFGRTTVPVMAHFANFRHKQDLGGTVFSLVYWVVAFAALIWPLIARRRRRGRDADPVKPGGHGDLAAVVGGTLLVTLFLFLSSKHPAEPWHLVPFLIMSLAPLACLVDSLWRRARPVPRVAAGGMVALVLAMGLPLNLAEIHPASLGMSLKVDGRHYPLFYHRLWQFYPRAEPIEHVSMRARWQILPLELEHATEWYTNHPNSFLGDDFYWPLVRDDDPHKAITDRILKRPMDTPRELAENDQVLAGYMLCRSHYNHGRPPKELYQFISRRPPREAGDLLEGIGFCVEARDYNSFIEAAWDHWGKDRGKTVRLLGRLAYGMGRGIRVPFLFKFSGFNCATLLPKELRVPFMEGLGFGHECRLLGEGIPKTVQDQVCPALRPALLEGAKTSGGRCNRVFDLYQKFRDGINPQDPDMG